jgi:hypothetical protein
MTVCAVAIAAPLGESAVWCEYLAFLGVYK